MIKKREKGKKQRVKYIALPASLRSGLKKIEITEGKTYSLVGHLAERAK